MSNYYLIIYYLIYLFIIIIYTIINVCSLILREFLFIEKHL